MDKLLPSWGLKAFFIAPAQGNKKMLFSVSSSLKRFFERLPGTYLREDALIA